MHTIDSGFRVHHRSAVLASVAVVDAVRPADLRRPTPCTEWNLRDLLAHMTVQHRGFAAAARGSGGEPALWRPENAFDAIAADPAGTYAAAANDVLEAFAADGTPDVGFALPEFGTGAVVPGATAMGFHFVDYVVHGWDVAATLGMPYRLPTDVVAAALPLALDVPDGAFRAAGGSPFGPAVTPDGADDFERILSHLGRRPEWNQSYSTVTGAWSDQRNA
jgi:uncharacterized protein (TIGR03086 family)